MFYPIQILEGHKFLKLFYCITKWVKKVFSLQLHIKVNHKSYRYLAIPHPYMPRAVLNSSQELACLIPMTRQQVRCYYLQQKRTDAGGGGGIPAQGYRNNFKKN